MVTRSVLALACLPLVLASAAAFAAPSPRQATVAKPAAARTQQAAPPRQGATRLPASNRRAVRSKERIYTVKPDMLEPKPPAKNPNAGAARVAKSDDNPFLGFTPTGNSVVGVGLWRVPKVDDLDPNRSQPLRDMKGKTGRAAAVGLQLSF